MECFCVGPKMVPFFPALFESPVLFCDGCLFVGSNWLPFVWALLDFPPALLRRMLICWLGLVAICLGFIQPPPALLRRMLLCWFEFATGASVLPRICCHLFWVLFEFTIAVFMAAFSFRSFRNEPNIRCLPLKQAELFMLTQNVNPISLKDAKISYILGEHPALPTF